DEPGEPIEVRSALLVPFHGLQRVRQHPLRIAGGDTDADAAGVHPDPDARSHYPAVTFSPTKCSIRCSASRTFAGSVPPPCARSSLPPPPPPSTPDPWRTSSPALSPQRRASSFVATTTTGR